VFGLSFPELCVLLVVAMVVLGPKDLPRYLRKAGQMAARLRRLAVDMREKSGIDEILRTEGLDREIAEFRRLARGEILGVSSAMRSVATAARIADVATSAPAVPATPPAPVQDESLAPVIQTDVIVSREREYPLEGVDSYGALSDTAVVYEGRLAPAPLAEDSLYVRGEEPAEAAAPPAIPPSATASATTA
jgi:sec-independent protein translocase protein TatB